MALRHYRGYIEWLSADAATTEYVITGLGFSPQAIRLVWNGTTDIVDFLSDTRPAQV